VGAGVVSEVGVGVDATGAGVDATGAGVVSEVGVGVDATGAGVDTTGAGVGVSGLVTPPSVQKFFVLVPLKLPFPDATPFPLRERE